MKLHPFQERGRDFLAGRKVALLADEMRLGKTPQAIAAARKVGARSVVVVCPAIAQAHWRQAWRDWWPGGPAPAVYSYNYLTLHLTKVKRVLGDIDVLMVDESHYCKSADAQRTKAVFGKRGLAHQAGRVWALTGTPCPNHVGELWPLLRTAGVVGSYGSFIRHYCWFTETGDIGGTRKDRVATLKRVVAPLMLRRTRARVAPELPKAEVYPWHVEAKLSAEALELDAAVQRDLDRLSPAEAAEYLEQHAGHLAQLRIWVATAKVPTVAATLVEELEAGAGPFVVFGYHRAPLEALKRALEFRGRSTRLVHGGVPHSARQEALQAFTARKADVFIGQLHAAGTAIDLSVACDGVLLERDWVPGVNAQALERMGGWKQTRPVTVREAIVPDTIDEVVARVVDRKQSEIEELMT